MALELTVKGSVETLRLQPGDVVVVTIDDEHLPREAIASIRAQLRDRFHGNDVLVLQGRLRLQVATLVGL